MPGCAAELAPAHVLQSPVAAPSLATVVQWLGTLVNAHLVAFALFPGAREVVPGVEPCPACLARMCMFCLLETSTCQVVISKL